jgi:hypothetical protein
MTGPGETPAQECIDFKDIFNELTEEQKAKVIELAQQYLESGQQTQLNKLLNNAIFYVHDKRVRKIDDSNFEVSGNHGTYKVSKDGEWSCDCDLFNGRGQYTDTPGTCSHIQSVELTE